ncbi:MAG: hypothetical protein HOP19_20665 [Acidobacteria bacterium]|nr:hypothetical protein [Acidobacteriota bacterium]
MLEKNPDAISQIALGFCFILQQKSIIAADDKLSRDDKVIWTCAVKFLSSEKSRF